MWHAGGPIEYITTRINSNNDIVLPTMADAEESEREMVDKWRRKKVDLIRWHAL